MLPVLQLGPLAIQTPGLALLIGVWLALTLAERAAPRHGLAPEAVYNLAFTALIAGILGARLAHAARYPAAYLADPLSLLSPSPALFAPVEGAAVGLLAALIYGQRRGLPGRAVLDAFAPALAVMAGALAAAHLASGDAFGAPARLPWSIFLWEEYRHPAQVYELLAALAAGVIAWRARPAFAGGRFLLVFTWLAAAALFLEAFRGDSALLPGGWRTVQVGALAALAGGLIMLERWRRAET